MSYIGGKPSKELASPTSQYFNGDGSTVAFTLDRPVNVAEDLDVFVSNVRQEPGSGKSYTATGTTLTFDAAPPSGTGNVYVVYRGLAEVTTRLEHDANAALAATTGTFSDALTATDGTFTDGLTVDKDGATVATFDRATSDGTIVDLQKNGTSVGSIGTSAANELTISSQWTDMFSGSGVALAPFNADDATADLGSSSGRFRNLYLSGGAYLGGTGSANFLDDYEEGSWNPNPRGGTTTGTYSIQYRSGKYIKVGNLVHCDTTLYVTSFNGTGNFQISGLPFNVSATSPGGLVLAQWNSCPFATYSSDNQHVVGLTPSNNDYIHFRASDRVQNGTHVQLQCGPSSITYLRLSFTYHTA